jgi:hypothetical protein
MYQMHRLFTFYLYNRMMNLEGGGGGALAVDYLKQVIQHSPGAWASREIMNDLSQDTRCQGRDFLAGSRIFTMEPIFWYMR